MKKLEEIYKGMRSGTLNESFEKRVNQIKDPNEYLVWLDAFLTTCKTMTKLVGFSLDNMLDSMSEPSGSAFSDAYTDVETKMVKKVKDKTDQKAYYGKLVAVYRKYGQHPFGGDNYQEWLEMNEE